MPEEEYNSLLLSHRNDLVSSISEQIAHFDRAMLALSGGGIATTIAFAKEFDEMKGGVSIALIICWLCFCVSIICTVGSFLLSTVDATKEIKKIDEYVSGESDQIAPGNSFRQLTIMANVGSLVCFVLGVCAFAKFVTG